MANNEASSVANQETKSGDIFLNIEYNLEQKLEQLEFLNPVKYVYNPLVYAKETHVKFVRKYFKEGNILFLGINPGPWGMCQTGIPFGEAKIVREWFNINGIVNHPDKQHHSKIITGLNCKRSEISGQRFWGLMRELCQTPENFFKHCLVHNLCPLAFLSETGKNLTPGEIKAKNYKTLNELCDNALNEIILGLHIKKVIAIGRFAEKRTLLALKKRGITGVEVSWIPHPSPRNARNYADWKKKTIEKLKELDVYLLLAGLDNL